MKNVTSKSKLLLILIIVLAALLRLPYLNQFPPALYSDEVDQGYNAFLILTTGRDEHGAFLPASLRSFGDWKPPLNTYLMIPSIALFGMNEWGVRMPSAILGVLTVGFVYLITKQLLFSFSKTSSYRSEKIALIAAFFVAISPWHILQSRSAMLVAVALFCTVAFVWSFLKSQNSPRFFLLAALFFSLGIYAYYGMRVVLPLLLIVLVWFFRTSLKNHTKQLVLSGAVIFILLLPLGLAYLNNPDVIFGRAKTVSVFHDRGIELTVWEQIAHDGVKTPSWLAQFFHNKPTSYAVDIVRRFFTHLDGRFLFLVGDKHPPFHMPDMGVLYIVDGLLLLIGIQFLTKKSDKLLWLIALFIAVSILPAALTFVTPASNRTLTLLVPFSLVVGIGMAALSKHTWLRICLVIVYMGSFGFFLRSYTQTLPLEYASTWHGGYKELVMYLSTQESSYERIMLSRRLSVPYIFVLFYRGLSIQDVEIRRDLRDDEFGFEQVRKFNNYEYMRDTFSEYDFEQVSDKTLIVLAGDEPTFKNMKEKKSILYPDSTTAFKIMELSE